MTASAALNITQLTIGGDPAAWAAIGVEVVDQRAVIAGIGLRFEPSVEPGLHAWGWSGAVPDDIEGVRTSQVTAPAALPPDPLGIVGWDHVVVMTSSLERTCAAIEAAVGAPLKRIREAGAIRQGFHRVGPVIVEVVESAAVTSPAASLWGFVWNVADIDATCERLGADVVTAPKAAVQPGRRIASVRAAAGLGVQVALMTPRPARS